MLSIMHLGKLGNGKVLYSKHEPPTMLWQGWSKYCAPLHIVMSKHDIDCVIASPKY